MDILFISVSAPPKNSPESLQTGRYLKMISAGHNVSLLTTTVTGGWEPEDLSLLHYLQNVKKIYKIKSLPKYLLALIRRSFFFSLFPDDAAFFFWQWKKYGRMIDKPQIVFSRSAPFSSAIMGLRLARYWNVPYVMHFSDVWADSPFLTVNDKLKKRHLESERECIAKADLITLTSIKTIEFYQKKYPQFKAKFRFLPNVFDDQDINQSPFKVMGKVRFVFTGRLYGSRSINQFLDSFENVFKVNPEYQNDAELVLAGFFDKGNIERIRKTFLSNVKYLGPLSLEKTLELQRNANVLILIDSVANDQRYDMFFPSKILDYLAAKKPILALTRKSSTTWEVIERGFGKCFSDESVESLSAYISFLVWKFKSGHYQDLLPSGDISEYSANMNSGRAIAMFKEVLDRA